MLIIIDKIALHLDLGGARAPTDGHCVHLLTRAPGRFQSCVLAQGICDLACQAALVGQKDTHTHTHTHTNAVTMGESGGVFTVGPATGVVSKAVSTISNPGGIFRCDTRNVDDKRNTTITDNWRDQRAGVRMGAQ